MNALCSFIVKFASLISWHLSCFDRLIFKGHLQISYPAAFERFVDYVLKMRRADFIESVAPLWSQQLVDHAKAFAARYGRLYEFYHGDIDKDAWAKEQLHKHPLNHGLIGVLCVMEACPSFKLVHAKERPCFDFSKIPQRVLYYYFWDKDLGLMHVRLQTYSPYTCQLYVNGHDYVMQKLKQRNIGFEKIDNAFVQLDDPKEAQRIANRFAKLPWPSADGG